MLDDSNHRGPGRAGPSDRRDQATGAHGDFQWQPGARSLVAGSGPSLRLARRVAFGRRGQRSRHAGPGGGPPGRRRRGDAGCGRSKGAVLSARGREPGYRPGAIDRRAARERRGPRLGIGPGAALSRGGGGVVLSGRAGQPYMAALAIGGRSERRVGTAAAIRRGPPRTLLGRIAALGRTDRRPTHRPKRGPQPPFPRRTAPLAHRTRRRHGRIGNSWTWRRSTARAPGQTAHGQSRRVKR